MRNKCLPILFLFVLTAGLAACQIEGPETGAAAVQLSFTPPPAPGPGTRGVLTGVVDQVRVTVSHGGKQMVSQDFPYGDLTGTVENIPVGDGRVFLAQALSGSDVVYQGTRSDITIAKGQTATVSIDMEPAYTTDVYAPTAVADLSGQASGADVNLGWTATGDDGLLRRAGSYDLRWSESTIQAANFDSATPVAGVPSPGEPGSAEQFTVTGLTPGGTYHFAIKVADDDGNVSAISNEAIVTTGGADTTAPAAVALAVDSVTDTTVTLSWTSPGDDGGAGTATVYDVRYLAGTTAIDDTNWATATEATGEPTPPQVAGSAETFTVTGLNEGQQYYFALKTGDEVPNWSDVSNSPNATPADTIAPSAVTDLRSPSNDETSVTLAWTAPGDDGATGTADHYDVRHLQGTYDAAGFDTEWSNAVVWTNPPTPQAGGSDETTVIDQGLVTGQTYTFALKTYDEVPLESPISNVVTIQVGVPDTDPPEAVTALAVSGVGLTSVTLTWPAPAEDLSTGLNTATAYDIRYLAGAVPIDDANWGTAIEVLTGEPTPQAPTTQETFEVTGLLEDTQYYFALKTVDDQNNWSAISNSPTGTTTDNVLPEDIDNLSITAFDEVSISLQWTAPGDDGAVGTVTAYDIRFAEAPIAGTTEWDAATQFGDLPTAPQAAPATETLTIATGLTQGHHYYIRMKTTDDQGNESGMSNEVDQLLPCPACPAVSGFRPAAAPVGAIISIDGTAFGATQGTGTVEFGATAATVLGWSDTMLVAEVPTGVTGTVSVTVTADSTLAGTTSFDVTPHIDSIVQNAINLGESIDINGSGFGSTVDTVTFTDGGSAPVFTVTNWTDTLIEVSVTSDVVTGPVTVTVGSHTSNSSMLTIIGGERVWSTPAAVWNPSTPGTVLSVFPRAANEVNGDVQVVWTESDPLAADLEILGKARVGGSMVGYQNLSDTLNDSTLPEIAGDGAGTYHLVYLDAAGAPDAILYTSGKHDTWLAVETVAGESMDNRPAIGLLADGTVVVAWSNAAGAVRYNTRSPAGVWGTASDVLTAGTNASSISGAVDPSGNFHIVYVNDTNLVHAWFDGTGWNDGGTVAAAAMGTLVALAADGRGILHALWWDSTLKYAFRDAAGWQTGTAPAAVNAAPQSLDLGVDAGDNLHAVVEDDSGAYVEILYFQAPPTGGWSAAVTLSEPLINQDSRQPCLLASPDLTLMVLWSENYRVRMVSWE